MKPSIRLIDRAAQGLSNTPLFDLIGRLEGKIATITAHGHLHISCWAKIKNAGQKCIAAATSTVPH
eukprot:scaffold26579_cov234-Skeletonema_marinoi.AAC.1